MLGSAIVLVFDTDFPHVQEYLGQGRLVPSLAVARPRHLQHLPRQLQVTRIGQLFLLSLGLLYFDLLLLGFS